MASDAVTVIMNDHRILERLFEQVQSGNGDRAAVLAECAARLAAHSHAEEQRVYPALAEADPSQAGEVQEGADEHHKAEMMLMNVQHLDPADSDFATKLDECIGAVRHHIHEEETRILPALREAVDQKKLDELGAVFERIRVEELKIAGIDESKMAV